jgi:hypothetical protein
MSKASRIIDPIPRQLDLVRLGARRVPVNQPYDPDVFADVCAWITDAGGMRLADTVRKYESFDSGEQLGAALAAKLGDARVSPNPPIWPLLAILILGWRESLSAADIALGRSESAREEVDRGLAIVVHLFPELAGWLAEIQLALPRWETTLAVPLAARRLLQAGFS